LCCWVTVIKTQLLLQLLLSIYICDDGNFEHCCGIQRLIFLAVCEMNQGCSTRRMLLQLGAAKWSCKVTLAAQYAACCTW
jgi:hypothetical protein